jgi:hypothetical protein
MVEASPVVEGWIVSLISVVFLTIQWIFMLLGLLGCCGYGLKRKKVNTHTPASTTVTSHSSVFNLVADFNSWRTRMSPQQTIASSLLFSVTCSLICSLCIFLRKFIRYSNDEDLPQSLCEFYCRTSLSFYGIAKIVIYLMMYFKVIKLVQTGEEEEGVLKRKKRILNCTVGFGLSAFAIAVFAGVITNSCIVTKGTCSCLTPPEPPIVFVVFDWVVSATLLSFFCQPIIRQMMNPNSVAKTLWKSVAWSQLKLAIAVLVVSPCMVAGFIYLDVGVPLSQRTLTATAFLTLDLLICCYAQGLAAWRIWGRRKRFLWMVNPTVKETEQDTSKNEGSLRRLKVNMFSQSQTANAPELKPAESHDTDVESSFKRNFMMTSSFKSHTDDKSEHIRSFKSPVDPSLPKGNVFFIINSDSTKDVAPSKPDIKKESDPTLKFTDNKTTPKTSIPSVSEEI